MLAPPKEKAGGAVDVVVPPNAGLAAPPKEKELERFCAWPNIVT